MTKVWNGGYFFVLHFDSKVGGHATHCYRWARSLGRLSNVLIKYREGYGGGVVAAAHDQGIGFQLAWIEPLTKDAVKSRSRSGSRKRFCEVCRADQCSPVSLVIPEPFVVPSDLRSLVVLAPSRQMAWTWCSLWGINPRWVHVIDGRSRLTQEVRTPDGITPRVVVIDREDINKGHLESPGVKKYGEFRHYDDDVDLVHGRSKWR